MDNDTLLNLYNELNALVESGDETQAMAIVQKRFNELPEEVQGELLTRLYFKSLEERADEAEVIAEIQEKSLEMIETLEILKKQIGEGSL